METETLRSYRVEFAKRAEWRREDERRVVDQIKQKDDKAEKQERDETEQEALMDYALAALASEADIADFNVRLDAYDAATVHALMENEQALETVREELRLMLDKAYVLPDGRRVFKTEDGTRVFDEHGQEVKDFDPKLVEDWRPHWERYQDPFEREAGLVQERKDLVEYQDLLDKTRDQANESGVTKAELDDLQKRLEANMPDAVKRQLPHDAELAQENDMAEKPQGTTLQSAIKLGMPTL